MCIFRKKEKQLYEITYQAYSVHTEIIAARSPEQAIRKFHKKHCSCWSVIDIKLYKISEAKDLWNLRIL